MHILLPRHVLAVGIEPRARRSAARAHVLCEIAAAALAEFVGVVRGWTVGDGFCGALVEVGEVVGDFFQFVGLELHGVVDYDVMGWFRLLVCETVMWAHWESLLCSPCLSGRRVLGGRSPILSAW